MSKQNWPCHRDKLWVSGFSKTISDEDLQIFCERFGHFIHSHRVQYKTDIFLTYLTEEDAAKAYRRFNEAEIQAKYAYNKRGSKSKYKSQSQQPSGNVKHIHFSNESTAEVQMSHGSSSDHRELTTNCAVFRSGEEVIITYVKNNFQFFARPKSMDHEYRSQQESISKSSHSAELLSDLPCMGHVLLAPGRDGTFQRAVVQRDVHSQSGDVSVHFIDDGISAEMPYKKLKILPTNLNDMRFNHKFKLSDITKETGSLYAAKCFKSFIGATLRMEGDESTIKPQTSIKLIDPNTNQNINELIKQMTLTFTVDWLKWKSPPIGSNKELTIVDKTKFENGDNLITFVDQEDTLLHYKQRNQIQSIARIIQNFPAHVPSDNELCLVYFKDSWYRGAFEEKKSESSAVILLVDIFKVIEIELTNIRKITEDFVQMKVLAFTAAIKSFKGKILDARLSEDLVATVIDSIEDEIVCAKTLNASSDGIYSIEM